MSTEYTTSTGKDYLSFPLVNPLLSKLNQIHLTRTLNSPQSYNSSNHQLTHILAGHLGCVNTLNWSRDGLLLLSGSDDQCLIIHKYTPCHPITRFKISNRFRTAHANNIFDAKFAPCDQDKIVSAAADGRVCIIDDWSARGWDTANTRTLIASATDDARRLEFIDTNNFLVACENGQVVQFDLRDQKPVRLIKIDLSGSQVGIHSIASCPSAPHLIALAATDPFIRFYDLRYSLDKTVCNNWTPPLKPDKKTNFCTGVRFSRFGYTLACNFIKDGPYLIDPIYQHRDSKAFELLQGKELVQSTGLENEIKIWLQIKEAFTTGKFQDAEKELRKLIIQHRLLQEDPNWRIILAHEIFNRVLCLGQLGSTASDTIKEDLLLVISIIDYWPARYLLVMYTFSLGLIEPGGLLCEMFLSAHRQRDASNPWITKLEHIKSIAAVCELDPAQIPKLIPGNFKRACSETPLSDLIGLAETRKLAAGFTGYLSYYPGILHERTLKGISFVGDSDQYIGAGSDGGYAFLFDSLNKNQTPVWATKSDTSVVNVVEGHPRLPCIAVSGIDNTIKIWEPDILNNSGIKFDSDTFKPINSPEIPSLMDNLSHLQGINRLELQINPFLTDFVLYL